MKITNNLIKYVAVAAAMVGVAASLVSDWAADKKMTETIKEEVERIFENS